MSTTTGVPPTELSGDELDRELRHAHEKLHYIFVSGTAEQLNSLRARTAVLEAEYLRRFADRISDADAKARSEGGHGKGD